MQQFEPLRRELDVQAGDTCEVSARPIEARNKSELDWVETDLEDDRYRRGRRLCGRYPSDAPERGDHGHLATNQIGHQCRQPIVVAFCRAIFDCHVAAL